MESSEGCLTDNEGNLILPNGTKTKKRKGGYSLEEIQYIAKMQMTPITQSIDEKIAKNKFEIEEVNREIQKIHPRIKKI